MSKPSASSRRAKQQKGNAGPTSKELARELSDLSKISDDEIDMTGMPEVLDWPNATVGKYYRPIKKPVSIRLDADVLDWLRATGAGYQSRLNDLARCWMIACSTAQRKDKRVSTRKTMQSAARAYAANESKAKPAVKKNRKSAKRKAG